MNKQKEIERCPVCGSGNIIQETQPTTYKHVVVKVGSHCADCGVKFVLNVKEKDGI